MAAKSLRENPPLTLEQKRELKILELKEYAVGLMNARLDGILSFEQIQIMREQYLSVAAGSRTPTANFQYLIDVWQEGKNEFVIINAYTLESEIDAYDVATNPTWP